MITRRRPRAALIRSRSNRCWSLRMRVVLVDSNNNNNIIYLHALRKLYLPAKTRLISKLNRFAGTYLRYKNKYVTPYTTNTTGMSSFYTINFSWKY